MPEWLSFLCLLNIFTVMFQDLKTNLEKYNKSQQALNELQVKALVKNKNKVN